MLALVCRVLVLTFSLTTGVLAQNYPNKPVHIVVPFQTGGSNDIVTRMLAPGLAQALGQPFVVENRPGAAGNVGADYVAKASADGHILLTSGGAPLAANASLYQKLSYDPLKDFAPVILFASQPNVLVIHPSLPFNNVKELIAYGKANPGKLTFGSSGVGATQHMAAELFMMKTGIKMVHVPYKGGGASMVDLVGGHINLIFETAPVAMPYIKLKQLRPLAVTTLARSGGLPDVPTLQESGVDGYVFQGWLGMVAPSGTPKDVIGRLNAEISRLIRGDLRARLTDLGLDVAGGPPEEFGNFLRDDVARYAEIVKAAGIKPE